MTTNTEFDWPTARFECRQMSPQIMDYIADRQDRLPEIDRRKLSMSTALLIGSGAFGGWTAFPMIRKGIAELRICDHDIVSWSNLSRQPYNADEIFLSKAMCLAKRVANEGHLGGIVTSHATAFTAETADRLAIGINVAICLVDNNVTRTVASHYFRHVGIPVVFAATNPGSNYAWVFVQETTGPCLGCVFPDMVTFNKKHETCPTVPSAIDIVFAVSGTISYAAASLLTGMERNWNFRTVHLVGGSDDVVASIPRRNACRLCDPEKNCQESNNGPTSYQ